MKIVVSEEPIAFLADYARIPIALEISRIFEVKADDRGGFVLSEHTLAVPYVKDYDAIQGEGPVQWAHHFDLSHWGLFAARIEDRLVGGAAVAFKTPGLSMLEDREDLAVLWDIRVSPEARGQSVEIWSAARRCKQLKVETQNINVPACRFYQARGCILKTINRRAYPAFPDEIQMLWYKNISSS